jgi:phosphoglycerol transferase MdoB-like AlkP superfamily enzyme
MRRTLFIFIKYYLFWLAYFVFYKGLFLAYNYDHTASLTFGEILRVFFYGSRMDLSAAGYMTMLPGVLLACTPLLKPHLIEKIIHWYTFIFLVINSFLGIIDLGLYPAWGTRLNAQILPYFSHPVEMMACLNLGQIILFPLIWAGIVALSIYLFLKIFKSCDQNTERMHWSVFPVLLLLSGTLILPIRSGLNTSPLNFSSVYFSPKLYANHSAYNFFWSFNYGLMHSQMDKNPLSYFPQDTCNANLKGTDQWNQENPAKYIQSTDGKPVNVVFIMLESFPATIVGRLGGPQGITPCFDKLCEEGILFSQFYSTGNRSDRGLAAMLGGYPPLIKASSILLFPEKMKSIRFLPSYFHEWGYQSSFHYGGDLDFFNTSMMLIQSNVEKRISNKNYPLKLAKKQKWGVPDGYLYQRVYQDLRKQKQPFFSMVYTISGHEPFDVPYKRRFKDGFENATSYADSCLGAFIDTLKASPLWKNTLIIITADHAHLYGKQATLEEPISYRIPMLWTGGAVKSSFECKNICMQTDLGATLIQQLGHKPRPSYFSKNIFGDKHFAIYIRDEGWGFLSSETGFYHNLESGQKRFFYGETNPAADSLDRYAKSFLQYLHADFIKR